MPTKPNRSNEFEEMGFRSNYFEHQIHNNGTRPIGQNGYYPTFCKAWYCGKPIVPNGGNNLCGYHNGRLYRGGSEYAVMHRKAIRTRVDGWEVKYETPSG